MKVGPVLLGAALALALLVPPIAAQVAIGEDPYHTQLLYTVHLRMYDVNIPPGTTTLDHRHDRDIATVALADTSSRRQLQGEEWTDVSARAAGSVQITNYTGAAAVHRVEAVGDAPYRLYAFENTRESGWTTPEIISAPGTALAEESRAFAVYEVTLDAGTPETSHTHGMPSVVTLLSGEVEVQGGGGETPFNMAEPGRWFPSAWEAPHTLRLPEGVDQARLICVEAR